MKHFIILCTAVFPSCVLHRYTTYSYTDNTGYPKQAAAEERWSFITFKSKRYSWFSFFEQNTSSWREWYQHHLILLGSFEAVVIVETQ